MNISLEDSYKGGKKLFEYQKTIICPSCKGNGSANPDELTTCTVCEGKGMKTINQKVGNIMLESHKTCVDCKGEGSVIKEKCPECKGLKVTCTKKKLKIDIDKGCPDGQRYTLKKAGDQYPNIESGDIIVEIFLQKHKRFIRKGSDLKYNCEISLLQALTGIELVITHLDKRKIIIQTKPGETINPLNLKIVKELGMPFFNVPNKYGDLYLEFKIIFPETLKENEISSLSEILKNERIHKNVEVIEDDEKYFLSDYKIEDENTDYSGGKSKEAGNEEDEKEKEEPEKKYNKHANCTNQ